MNESIKESINEHLASTRIAGSCRHWSNCIWKVWQCKQCQAKSQDLPCATMQCAIRALIKGVGEMDGLLWPPHSKIHVRSLVEVTWNESIPTLQNMKLCDGRIGSSYYLPLLLDPKTCFPHVLFWAALTLLWAIFVSTSFNQRPARLDKLES